MNNVRIRLHYRNGTNRIQTATVVIRMEEDATIGEAVDKSIEATREAEGVEIRITEIEIIGSVVIQ